LSHRNDIKLKLLVSPLSSSFHEMKCRPCTWLDCGWGWEFGAFPREQNFLV